MLNKRFGDLEIEPDTSQSGDHVKDGLKMHEEAVMLGLGLKAKFSGLGLGLGSMRPWPWNVRPWPWPCMPTPC